MARFNEIRTEIIINASVSVVWEVLMEFDRYPEWNPFIKSIKGVPAKGSKITVRLEPPETRGMTITPTVLEVIFHKELRWLGHLVIPGLFDGEHIFELTDNNDGTTTFIHRENFRGILVPFFKKMLDINTRMGFEMMNRQMKVRSEIIRAKLLQRITVGVN